MPRILLGLAFLVFGAVSIYEALRIGGALRARGTLDIVGPDRYLFGVAVLLVAVGALLLVQAMAAARRSPRPRPSVSVPVEAAGEDVLRGRAHLWLFAALAAYVSLLPVLGYLVATVLFAAAAFRIMGMTGAWRVALAAILLTVVCYASFVAIADLPLPRGMLGL